MNVVDSGNIRGARCISDANYSHLLPRTKVKLLSRLVVEATGERVEHCRVVPNNQIPPVLSKKCHKLRASVTI